MRDLAQSPRQEDKTHSASMLPVIPLEGHAMDNMSKLSLKDDEAVYTGSSHWITILEDVRGPLQKIIKKRTSMMTRILADSTS